MKTRLTQLAIFVNKIDRRQLQLAYFILMLAGALILKAPSDGGVGPY